MQNRASFLSDSTDHTFSAMEQQWRKPPFRLHYVTAREAYNIVKAAEAGHSGNPNDYRDFAVARPANRVIFCDRLWRLLCYSPRRIELALLEPGRTEVHLAEGPLQRIAGCLRYIDLHIDSDGELVDLHLEGDGDFEVDYRDGASRPASSEHVGAAPASLDAPRVL
jgi:hypothetical protein